ncbi:16398_t:CDS:2, partial [Rhizophagus irregularis]
KQKAANPKDMIIDWSGVETSDSPEKSQYEMDRDLRTALRNKIARIMDRLPEDKALNTRKTFDSQRKLVQNNIIPTSSPESYYSIARGMPIGKISKKEESIQIQDEKRERRNKTIDKLKKLKDRLINKFHTNELRPLQTDNRYHSPEVSETDSDNPNKRKIIIRDLKWRSATLLHQSETAQRANSTYIWDILQVPRTSSLYDFMEWAISSKGYAKSLVPRKITSSKLLMD